MRALVTGFEPFDGATVNASERIVRALGELGLPQVVCKVLPTAYARAETAIEQWMSDLRPQLVLMLGLNARAEHLHFEQVALNLDDSAKADNDGEIRQRVRIRTAAPAAYFSTLFYERLRSAASNVGEDLLTSRDAGGFVCNHVFFAALHCATTLIPGAQVGFVHLPLLADPLREQRVVRLVESWLTS